MTSLGIVIRARNSKHQQNPDLFSVGDQYAIGNLILNSMEDYYFIPIDEVRTLCLVLFLIVFYLS